MAHWLRAGAVAAGMGAAMAMGAGEASADTDTGETSSASSTSDASSADNGSRSASSRTSSLSESKAVVTTRTRVEASEDAADETVSVKDADDDRPERIKIKEDDAATEAGTVIVIHPDESVVVTEPGGKDVVIVLPDVPDTAVIEVPVIEVPVDEPPVVKEPVDEPPVIEVPVKEPPVIEEPVDEPPVTEVPVKEPPVVEEPVDEPPVIEVPVDEPPVVEEPVDEPPVIEEPVDEPPVIEEPVDEPPVTEVPVDEPPVVEEPVDEPPVAGSPQYPDAVTAPVTWRSMVSDVLRWVGLPALSESSWIPAVVVPWPLNQLWMGLRRIEYHLFNDRPQARPQQLSRDAVTGVVIGSLNGTDGDGDKITYTLVDLPVNGHVEVLADGTYRYTPTAAFAHAGGFDKFTVRVEDKAGNPWHAHGLAGWFGLSRGTTVTVTVALDPVTTAAASIPALIEAPDSYSSGLLAGTLLGLDSAGEKPVGGSAS